MKSLVALVAWFSLTSDQPKTTIIDYDNYSAVCQEILKRSQPEEPTCLRGSKVEYKFNNYFDAIPDKEGYKRLSNELGCGSGEVSYEFAYAYYRQHRQECRAGRDRAFGGFLTKKALESYDLYKCDQNVLLPNIDRALIKKSRNQAV